MPKIFLKIWRHHQPHVEAEQRAAWHNHFIKLISDLETGWTDKHMIALCDHNEFYNGNSLELPHYEEDMALRVRREVIPVSTHSAV